MLLLKLVLLLLMRLWWFLSSHRGGGAGGASGCFCSCCCSCCCCCCCWWWNRTLGPHSLLVAPPPNQFRTPPHPQPPTPPPTPPPRLPHPSLSLRAQSALRASAVLATPSSADPTRQPCNMFINGFPRFARTRGWAGAVRARGVCAPLSRSGRAQIVCAQGRCAHMRGVRARRSPSKLAAVANAFEPMQPAWRLWQMPTKNGNLQAKHA